MAKTRSTFLIIGNNNKYNVFTPKIVWLRFYCHFCSKFVPYLSNIANFKSDLGKTMFCCFFILIGQSIKIEKLIFLFGSHSYTHYNQMSEKWLSLVQASGSIEYTGERKFLQISVRNQKTTVSQSSLTYFALLVGVPMSDLGDYYPHQSVLSNSCRLLEHFIYFLTVEPLYLIKAKLK